MADPVILLNANVFISTSTEHALYVGRNFSNRMTAVNITRSVDIHDVTHMGLTDKKRATGLREWNAECEVLQAFTTADGGENVSVLTNTLADLAQAGGSFHFAVLACSTLPDATNPRMGGVAIIGEYQPIAGSLGDPLKMTIPFISAGSWEFTTATSSSA